MKFDTLHSMLTDKGFDNIDKTEEYSTWTNGKDNIEIVNFSHVTINDKKITWKNVTAKVKSLK